jgi:hypothetical protein
MGGGIVVPEDESQERAREAKCEDRSYRASKAQQEHRLAANMVRTTVPINCGGRLCGVVNGYLSLLSDVSHSRWRKTTRETYYDPCVVAHLPHVSAHDREVSDELNAN